MKKLITFLCFSALVIFYYVFSFDKVSFGDCIAYVYLVEKNEWTTTASSLDHFLYTNALILFHRIIAIDTIDAIRWFNSLIASTSVYLFYLALRNYFNLKFSVLGVLIMSLSFTFWRSTSTIEICSFNTLFLSGFLLFSIRFLKTKNIKDLHLVAIILGISFWSHVQNIMLIPSFIFLLYLGFKNYGSKTFVSLLAFLTPTLGLFIPALIQGYPLIDVYASSNSSWVAGTFNKSILDYLKDIVIALGYLVYNLWYFIIPASVAIFYRFRKITPSNIFYFFAFGVPFGFGTFYNVSDNYVYFIGPYQILILYAIDGLRTWSKNNLPMVKWSFFAALAFPLLYFLAFKIALLTPQGLAFHESKEYKGGLNYYMKPWMNNNVGILEVYLKDKPHPKDMEWQFTYAIEFIKLRSTYQSLEKIEDL